MAGHDGRLNLLLKSDFDRNIGILNFKFYILKKSGLLLQISNSILIWAPYGPI
jgi:hypothetical protein